MNKIIYILFAAMVVQGCADCKTCNVVLSEEQLAWLPYEDNELLYFTSDSADARFFVIGEAEIKADEEICRNLENPCTTEKGFKIYETDTFQTNLDYAGDAYIFATDQDYFAGVMNMLDKQISQNGLDSILYVESADSIGFFDSLLINDLWYTNCYEILFDSSTTDTINTYVRFIYQKQNGLIEFNNQGGVSWKLKEI